MTLGWAERWKSWGWMRSPKKRGARYQVKNPDLWDRLLNLCKRHQVEFRWVKGHAGNPENELCDRLSTQAAGQANLPVDEGYESPSGGLLLF